MKQKKFKILTKKPLIVIFGPQHPLVYGVTQLYMFLKKSAITFKLFVCLNILKLPFLVSSLFIYYIIYSKLYWLCPSIFGNFVKLGTVWWNFWAGFFGQAPDVPFNIGLPGKGEGTLWASCATASWDYIVLPNPKKLVWCLPLACCASPGVELVLGFGTPIKSYLWDLLLVPSFGFKNLSAISFYDWYYTFYHYNSCATIGIRQGYFQTPEGFAYCTWTGNGMKACWSPKLIADCAVISKPVPISNWASVGYDYYYAHPYTPSRVLFGMHSSEIATCLVFALIFLTLVGLDNTTVVLT
jgi:hypothetical protein